MSHMRLFECAHSNLQPTSRCVLESMLVRHQLVRGLLPKACAACRNMQDLWDEEYTDLCRENFINAMYKFPDTPVTELENGREMPILGVGTWLKQNVQDTIEQALRAGFRCAHA